MGHYDYMYENLTKDDALQEKEREHKYSKGLERDILQLQEDVVFVKYEKTQKVIQREIESLERNNKRTKDRILAWNHILERIEKGECVSYSEKPRIIY